MPGAKETYDSLCAQYPVKWETSFSKEIGQLAQVVGTRMKRGHIFITRNQVPTGQKIRIQIQYAIIAPEKTTHIASD